MEPEKARTIVDAIRQGSLPSPNQCDEWCQYPQVDVIRKLIQTHDWEPVRNLCESRNEYQREFGVALLRNIQDIPEIKQYLMDYWSRPDLTFRERIALQFTLLVYTDLTSALHAEMRQFVFDNYEQWIGKVRQFAKSRGPVTYADERLQSSPPSKSWVYLCCLPGASEGEKERAKDICRQYLSNQDAFTQETARIILTKI